MDKKKFFFIGIILAILIFGVVFKSLREKSHAKIMDKKSTEELKTLENGLKNLIEKDGVEIVKNGDVYQVKLEEGTKLNLKETEDAELDGPEFGGRSVRPRERSSHDQ